MQFPPSRHSCTIVSSSLLFLRNLSHECLPCLSIIKKNYALASWIMWLMFALPFNAFDRRRRAIVACVRCFVGLFLFPWVASKLSASSVTSWAFSFSWSIHLSKHYICSTQWYYISQNYFCKLGACHNLTSPQPMFHWFARSWKVERMKQKNDLRADLIIWTQ